MILFQRKNKSSLVPAQCMRQLACMISAGISIVVCFDILANMQQNQDDKVMLHKVRQQLLTGSTLHESMQYLPVWFDRYAERLVHLGEQTGKLESVMTALAQYFEYQTLWQRKIRQALFYPACILIAALLLTLAMFIFVIPAFAELFQDSRQALPWLTRLLFHLSSLLNQHSLLIMLISVSGLTTLFLVHRKGSLIMLTQRLMHLPPLKHAYTTFAMARFTHHLAFALQAGLPILHALQLTGGLCTNKEIARGIRQLRAAISAGTHLHAAMASIPVFPPLVRQMIKTGEETGKLDLLLEKSANLLDEEFEAWLIKFSAMLEPLIMSILGVLIGGLVIGMYLPVFNLGSAL